MFIKAIRLQGFGRLTGTCDFKQGQCNVLCQDNEFGKTTLMDAVLYALYDFPSIGFKRTDLKPKERYRPWNNGNGGAFAVELDIVTSDARELRLRADFSRQNPFELTDLQTWQKLPLDSSTFGQRYFRMPLQSFTGCFFYRQDERDTSGRDDLIRVIEEAAASNQRQQPSSVRQAISALSDARLHIPEFSADAIQVENLLKRIDEKSLGVRRQLEELEREKEMRSGSIADASAMDEQVQALQKLHESLQYAVIMAELHELDTMLRRQDEVTRARAQREERIAELQPYAAFDPNQRSHVQSLLADWRASTNRIFETRQRFDLLSPKTAELAEQLATVPSDAATFTAEQLEEIRGWQAQLADRRAQAADERRRADGYEADLRGRGVPVEELDSATEKLQLLSESEREILLDPSGKRHNAESALLDAERRAAEARATLADAKVQRNKFATYAGATITFAGAAIVAGVVLILANYVFVGTGIIVLALIIGGVLLSYFLRAQREIAASRLTPAAEQEISITAEVQKLREAAQEMRSELDDICNSHQLTEEVVKQLKSAVQWIQAAGPYQSAREAASRLSTQASAIRLHATPAVRSMLPQLQADAEITEIEIGQAADLIARYHEITTAQATTEAELTALQAELDELQSDAETKRTALIEQLQPALESIQQFEASVELESLVTAFEHGCEQAIRLQTMLAETQMEEPLTASELEHAIPRAESLRALLDEMQQANSHLANATLDPRPRAAIQDELASVDRQREELRVRRTDLFNESDRAVEAWRHEGPKLQEELDRLAGLRRHVTEFQKAVELAHRELSDIADQVFRQWATAINERVNEVLPLINPKYKDVGCSNELELSAYSHEVGRRLDGRELQHLSKGARDQLQMALRVAISEYLSAHVGNLPLVFDEPFAHWDDARFVEGMRFLANLTERHQVILLSCHHWRYEQLQKTHPDLAARLHFCTLSSEPAPEALPAAEPAPAATGSFL